LSYVSLAAQPGGGLWIVPPVIAEADDAPATNVSANIATAALHSRDPLLNTIVGASVQNLPFRM
jgi:hypothetical protein